MPLPVKQSSPLLADNALRLPTEFPGLPIDVIERFPDLAHWQAQVATFFQEYESGVRDFAGAVQDTNELGGVLIADPQTGAIYIHPSRGGGSYANPDTPFYVDRQGFFSLGSSLTWDPNEKLLTIDGTINVDSGTIGGFEIGTDYIRDEADGFGLSSEQTGGNDVRFWAGDTFANKDVAPFRVYEDGSVVAYRGLVGGFELGTDYIRDIANSMGLSSNVSGGDDVRFWAGDTFANRATAPFQVTESGVLIALDAIISGSIDASTGTIGGFSIGADYIRDAANSFGLSSVSTGGDDVRFWAGETFANRATAPFRVTESGILTLDSDFASITIGDGYINATGFLFGDPTGTRVTLETTDTAVYGLMLRNSDPTIVGILAVNGTTEYGYLLLKSDDALDNVQVDYRGLEFNGDTNLYRGGADLLATDDDFAIGGELHYGTHSAIGAETVTGYITMRDTGGTVRKLAVVS